MRADGRLNAPYYWDGSRWRQLTYHQRPLDLAIGVGLDTSATAWHKNAEVKWSGVVNDPNAGRILQEFPWDVLGQVSGATTVSSDGRRGVGALTYSGAQVTIDGVKFGVTHVYTLRSGDEFVEVTTTLTNLETTKDADNVRVWVGTDDDFLAGKDQLYKMRGNVADGTFARLTKADDASNAIAVFDYDVEDDEGTLLFFYSTFSGRVDSVFGDTGHFKDEIVDLAPEDSGADLSRCKLNGSRVPDESAIDCLYELLLPDDDQDTFDAGYALALDLGTIKAGESSTFTYYYALLSLDDSGGDIAGAISDVAALATAPRVTPDSGNGDGATTSPTYFAPGGVLPLQSPGLGEWVQSDGSSVPLAVSSPGPNQVRYTAEGVQVTFTGGAGSDASRGLVADPNGEIVCEVCIALAAGQVIEVWMFSTPRLVAAHLTQDLPCQRVTIPVVAPLDGGGPVSAGAHTLQLALPTAQGLQAVNVGVTVGGPVPTRVPAGEGPTVPGWLVAFGLLAAVGALAVRRQVVAG